MPPKRLVSLRDMLELNAKDFLSAVTELRSIQLIINNMPDKNIPVGDGDRAAVIAHVERLIEAIEAIGARSAFKSAERLQNALSGDEPVPGYPILSATMADIESRFADHLDDIILFVVSDEKAKLFQDAYDLVDFDIVLNFASSVFEFEEAAKCRALGRYTASVFHSMRVLEIGIKAFAKYLGIEDPVKAADRNWSIMLSKIKEKIDQKWPQSKRLAGSEGATMEGIYATLDSVRNPWRNATMHVESIYAPHEAEHIFNCVVFFMQTLAKTCNEDGEAAV